MILSVSIGDGAARNIFLSVFVRCARVAPSVAEEALSLAPFVVLESPHPHDKAATAIVNVRLLRNKD